MSENLPLRIKEAREKLGYSQAEVARKLRVARSTVSMYERGNREPRYTDLLKLAQVLKVTPSYLMGWTDDEATTGFDPFSEKMRATWAEEEDRLVAEQLVQLAKDQEEKMNPKLVVLHSRSKQLTDQQLDRVNGYIDEIVKEQNPYDD